LGLVSPDEAASGTWLASGATADVVRVEHPPPECWPALRAAGFLPKPQQITWLAEVGGSEEEFTARLAGGERQKIRGARRALAADGLSIGVERLDATVFDAFLVV